MSAKSVINLQDGFLNQIRKDNILTTVYLVNGFQLKGLVKGFDNFTVLLDVDGKQMLIYKHAISTINPIKPVSLSDQRERESDAGIPQEDTPQG
ncbi:MAG: RNA chaperone Hfq [Bacillota bacterium]